MTFYLGTHQVDWLGRQAFADVPLFVSARRLRARKVFPRATGRWALDSGGFSEISLHGRWQTTPEQYAAETRRWRDEIGGLEWAAVQDWMCEPHMLKRAAYADGVVKPLPAKLAALALPMPEGADVAIQPVTFAQAADCCPDLTPEQAARQIERHQVRTFNSYIRLCALDGQTNWVPVLQGWEPVDYLRHADYYERMLGRPLSRLPLVGLGSVCRRQHTGGILEVAQKLHARGIRLHGFGVKLTGLPALAPYLASSDSMAWSLNARKHPPLPGCPHRSCSSCPKWAMRWRDKVLRSIDAGERQPALF